MGDFLKKLFVKEKDGSKDLAKERLRIVLVHDRATVAPHLIDNLKQDLIEVISRYMEFDETALDVQMDSKEDMVALEVNIPIVQLKREYNH